MVIKANRTVTEKCAIEVLSYDAETALLVGYTRADWLMACALRAEHAQCGCCVPGPLERLMHMHITDVAMIAAFTFIPDRN